MPVKGFKVLCAVFILNVTLKEKLASLRSDVVGRSDTMERKVALKHTRPHTRNKSYFDKFQSIGLIDAAVTFKQKVTISNHCVDIFDIL